jgi:potassium-transporting ATPase KdpC subunit
MNLRLEELIMFRELRAAAVLLVVLSIVTGIAYPLLVTGIAQVAFPSKANGSLIDAGGMPVQNGARGAKDGARAVGSELIGQPFSDPKHFWSRPSATSPYPYNASSSSGSNMGPLNPALTDAVTARVKALRDADPGNTSPVPADLVTASASGLDPHISPAAAEYQMARVARLRGLDVQKVRTLVAQATQGRQFGFLGEPRVNVLRLNLALDAAP